VFNCLMDNDYNLMLIMLSVFSGCSCITCIGDKGVVSLAQYCSILSFCLSQQVISVVHET